MNIKNTYYLDLLLCDSESNLYSICNHEIYLAILNEFKLIISQLDSFCLYPVFTASSCRVRIILRNDNDKKLYADVKTLNQIIDNTRFIISDLNFKKYSTYGFTKINDILISNWSNRLINDEMNLIGSQSNQMWNDKYKKGQMVWIK